MIYRKRSYRRSVRFPNLMLGLYLIGTGLSSLYCSYFDVVLSHTEPERRGMSLALLYAYKHLTSLLGVFVFLFFKFLLRRINK